MNDSPTRAHVLLVDDDPDFLETTRLGLQAADCEVVTATSVSEAKARLAEFTPDLAVFDLMLDEMDGGFQLCHVAKQKHPNCPVILCSAVKSETGHDFGTDTEEQRRWIRADAFLTKPIRFEELKAQIERLVPPVAERQA